MRVYLLDAPGKIRDELMKLLSAVNMAYEIKGFEDYTRFIEQTNNSPPDYCFIRLGRDGIPGLKAAEAVQSVSGDIRVVFVSEDKRNAVDAYEVGAFGYLSTPITKEKIEKYLIVKN